MVKELMMIGVIVLIAVYIPWAFFILVPLGVYGMIQDKKKNAENDSWTVEGGDRHRWVQDQPPNDEPKD